MEEDRNYKQIVAQFVIINPFSNEIFVYKKSCDARKYQETRLGGYFSILVGGHIEKKDKDMNSFHNDLILSGGLRELEEEGISIEGSLLKMELVGFLNQEIAQSVYHLGACYLIETIARKVILKKADSEITRGEMMPLANIKNISQLNGWSKLENWSIAILPFIKNYLSRFYRENNK